MVGATLVSSDALEQPAADRGTFPSQIVKRVPRHVTDGAAAQVLYAPYLFARVLSSCSKSRVKDSGTVTGG